MEPTDHNLRAWDEVHRRRAESLEPGLPPPVRHALGDLKGKVVFVAYWGIDCPHCIAEIPQWDALYKKFHAEGFEIIALERHHTSESTIAATLGEDTIAMGVQAILWSFALVLAFTELGVATRTR